MFSRFHLSSAQLWDPSYTPKIRFDDVSVRIGDATILDHITLNLNEHRIAIIGENGGGKSTLVRLINGLNDPTEGDVSVGGLDTKKYGKEIRMHVGFIFSDADNQIIMPTVGEDVAFSLRKSSLSSAEKKHAVHTHLARFGLDHLVDVSPYQLSGGQKQLLALTSVLITEPDIVIADEPTTLLDLKNKLRLRAFIRTLKQQVIVVTHDVDFVDDFDRIIWVDKHCIAEDGTPDRVLPHYISTMYERSREDC